MTPLSRPPARRPLWIAALLALTLGVASGLPFAPAASAQSNASIYTLADRIDAVLDHRDFQGAAWGALIVDLNTGRTFYSRSPESAFVPASNMKLYTTAAVLDALGPDFRYATRLYADGPVQNGTLRGSLVVRGSGDPAFGGRYTDGGLSRTFRQWADSLRAQGVRRIAGPEVRTFEPFPVADRWWDGYDTAEPSVEPAPRGPSPSNAAPAPVAASSAASRSFVPALVAILRQAGIEVAPEHIDVDDWDTRPRYDHMVRVATHYSPPLRSIIGVTNADSNNLYAEHLLRTLGANRYYGMEFAVGSIAAGAAAAEPFLNRIGVDPYTLRVADGSGLSALNRLTPLCLIQILRAMHEHEDPLIHEAFVRSLAVGGMTGTLKSRYRSGRARGNVRAKTGYIRNVRTLSGYVTAANGHTLAFSLLCNQYTVPVTRVNQAQDLMVEMLAQFE